MFLRAEKNISIYVSISLISNLNTPRIVHEEEQAEKEEVNFQYERAIQQYAHCYILYLVEAYAFQMNG